MGNIGVGKTTLCKILKNEFEKHGIKFNVEYEKQDECPYMEDYYKDMSRWAFSTQLYFLRRKFEAEFNTEKLGKNCIIDRLIDEDVYVFASILHEMGYIDDRDWQNYNDTFELMKPYIRKYDIVLYIKNNMQNTINNIIKRGRKYEQEINTSYISMLEKKYDELAKRLTDNGTTVVFIDSNGLDFENVLKDRETIMNQIPIIDIINKAK